MIFKKGAVAAFVAMTAMGTASAVPVQITVTNNQSDGGFAFTPVYFGFHDGSFDAFDVGGEASEGVEDVAEIGSFGAIAGERQAAADNTAGAVVASPDGPPPLQPGESATIIVDLDPTTQSFVTYLAMLLPTNDAFFGNDDALQLFDDMGNFTNPAAIDISGDDIYDAGTEANDLTNGPAFAFGQVGTDGLETDGVITGGLTAELLGFTDDVTTAPGDIVTAALAAAFFEQNLSLATISFSLVDTSEIPVPAAALLFAPAVAGLSFMKRRRAKA